MVVGIIFASIVGGTVTIALVWPYEVLLAFLAAPFGGSMTALVVAVFATRVSGEREAERATDDMVRELRTAARQGRGHHLPAAGPAWSGKAA